MAKRTRRAGLGMVVAAVMATLPQPALASEPTLVVDVQNLARVPGPALERAKATATEIYDAIGVRVVWAGDEGPTAIPETVIHLTVILIAGNAERNVSHEARAPLGTLGLAPPNTNRVYVFCDRVSGRAALTLRPFGLTLGRVLAHEVGHQLLPGRGHSRAGIMRANLDDESPAINFTPAEGKSIRALLSANGRSGNE